jgi:hypothetical protein
MRRFISHLAGVEVSSDVALPGLPPVAVPGRGRTIVLDVEEHPAERLGDAVFRWPGRYGMTLHTTAEGWALSTTYVTAFLSADGYSIRCQPAAPGSDWRDVVVRRILPRVAQWHGRLALHASAVAIDGAAVLVTGASGAGKSTLAGALCRFASGDLICDDIALVESTSGRPEVWPIGRGLALWPDSLSALAPSLEDCALVTGHDQKRTVVTTPVVRPTRVAAVIMLAGASDVAAPHLDLAPLPSAGAARALGAHIVSFNPSDPTFMQRSWSQVGQLVSNVPVSVLRHDRRHDRLEEMATALHVQLRQRLLASA